jgi:uncharacterized membrane protein HdeD (DUF308 family)
MIKENMNISSKTLNLILLLTGLLLAFFPNILRQVLTTAGFGLIIFAAITIVLRTNSKKIENNTDMVMAIILGIVFIIIPTLLMPLIPTVIGIIAIINGIERFSFCMKLKTLNQPWVTPLIFALLFLGGGIYAIINHRAIMRDMTFLIGIILVILSIYRLTVSQSNIKVDENNIIDI